MIETAERAAGFDYASLERTAHRPWPRPRRPWVMTQTWHDVLFLHWPVAARDLRPRVPAELELDLRDGTAWLGIVAFWMSNVGPRGLPNLPGVSRFAELNVRTYVRAGGRAGVYFFSLDAESALAVQAARTLLNLPYHTAEMRVREQADRIDYESKRTGSSLGKFAATYEPVGAPAEALAGTLEHFLVERYCLFHRQHGNALYRLDIHHAPWPLQAARATVSANDMAEVDGLALPNAPPLIHFARRQDVAVWLPVPAERVD